MKVTFQENGHKYFDTAGQEYISVTTLIGKYKEYFDAEYWSMYKAIERYFIEYKGDDTWRKTKQMVGYKSINRFFKNYAKDSEKEIVEKIQKEILQEWDVIREDACFQGTAYHERKELKWKSEIYHRVGNDIHFLRPQDMVDFDYGQIPNGLYSELLIYSNKFKVAGQADLVIIDKPYVDIGDYKTNKKLDKVSYQNKKTKRYKMMLHPVKSLMDCNFMHYQLQLSLYAYMLEQFGLKVRNLWIEHVKRNKKGELNPLDVERHTVKYLKSEVEKILQHYAKSRKK